MTEIAKAYDPKGVEDRWYAFWEERGYFVGHTGAAGEPFSISMPPGNITGALHIGGALNNIIQDTIIRRVRMQGRPTVWIPGTDHAAIATQAVLERRLAAEGKTRFDLGREAFEQLFWQWKDTYEARILGALRKLGCSADWTRTRFTMDPGLSFAVRTVFVRLFEEGHIYRGNRIINWCPKCASTISDIEVIHVEKEGELVTLRYPLKDGSGHISVATTRVETMLGDTGVAVHSVAHCDRTPDTEIEPWLSEQWFVAMKELAQPAIDVVKEGKIRFIPHQPFTRVYLDWMENIRDWCISRQLWLGHRIPAWYCPDGHVTVALEDPDACATCGSTEIEHDEDTLDTWFSSGLW